MADELPEGWIAHDGGPCPVRSGDRVAIRFRSGELYVDLAITEPVFWAHCGDQFDVIAYKPEAPDHGR